MKKATILLGLLLIFNSCSKIDDESGEFDYVGKWKLIKSTGNIPDSELTGDELEWQESYVFHEDGTVLKSQDRDGKIIEISGTYAVVNISNEEYLKLQYNSESKIIGSCTSEPQETLFLNPDNTLKSTWNACDGPGLVYEKVD